MRVGLLALLQESNTFLSQVTELRHFAEDVLLEGEAVRERFAGSHHEIGGMLAGMAETDIEVVPIFAARAYPFGVITKPTWDELMRRMFAALDKAGPLDGVLASIHGATVSAEFPDADGHWLGRVRVAVGPKLPIIGTLDPHVNLSEQMVASCDALIAYRTNPHLDQFQRGREAASLMIRTLRGEIKPTQAASFPPTAISIECQYTSQSPCVPLYALADEIAKRPGVLSNSVMLGFPYADVPEIGSAMLVVTDNQPALAQKLANEMGSYLWDHREEFVGKLLDVEQALDRAATLPGPVCLLDMGDNAGGGGPADSTWIASALLRRGTPDAFVCLYDPAAVIECEAAGPETTLTLSIGGHSGPLHGEPLSAEFTVLGLYEGQYEEPETRHGGFTMFDQGRTAVVRTAAGLTVMITSRRSLPFSLRQLTSCGLDPASFQLLVAKGVNAPIAAYEKVCKSFVQVNTAGVTCADMTKLPFERRRRPMYPFEREAVWEKAK